MTVEQENMVSSLHQKRYVNTLMFLNQLLLVDVKNIGV